MGSYTESLPLRVSTFICIDIESSINVRPLQINSQSASKSQHRYMFGGDIKVSLTFVIKKDGWTPVRAVQPLSIKVDRLVVQSYGCGSGKASSTMGSAGCSSFQSSAISWVLRPMLALLFTLPVKAPGTFSAERMRLSTRTLTLRLPWASMVGRKMAMPVWTERPSLSRPVRVSTSLSCTFFTTPVYCTNNNDSILSSLLLQRVWVDV
jgi:hypothetical protein